MESDQNDTAINTSTASARGQSVKVSFKIFAICTFGVKNENRVDFCPQIKGVPASIFSGSDPCFDYAKWSIENLVARPHTYD